MTERDIFDKLMDAIGNAYGVCGLMGNIKAESGMKSINMQNSYESLLGMDDVTYTLAVDSRAYGNFATDRVGYGFCQWTSPGRKAAFLSYAKEVGTGIGDAGMQLDYLLHELSTTYRNVLAVLKAATSVKEASDYVVTEFERPADQSKSVLDKRAAYGEAFYEQFVGKNKDKPRLQIYEKGIGAQLSKNFKSTEFDCNGKGCCQETPIDSKLVEVLQNIRNHFGVSVNLNCGYRCPVHNAKVSGASGKSQHLLGRAADIVVKGVHPVRVARYIETIPGFAGRIGCYTWDDKGSGFVHVDVRGKSSRGIYTDNNTDYDSIVSFDISIKRGMKGRLVRVVQRKLKSVGLYSGKIDGKCGGGTEKGIIAWNEVNGRPNDASWGPKCWEEAFPCRIERA